jgi:hypothetical protein
MRTTFDRNELIGLLAKLYVREVLKDNAVLTRKWLGEKWESFNDTACARPDGLKGRITNEGGVEAECVATDIVISETSSSIQFSFGYRTVFPAPPAPAPEPEPEPEPEPVAHVKRHK